MPEGQGFGNTLTLSVAGQQSFPPTLLFSYMAPEVRHITPDGGPTCGQACSSPSDRKILTVVGNNFGAPLPSNLDRRLSSAAEYFWLEPPAPEEYEADELLSHNRLLEDEDLKDVEVYLTSPGYRFDCPTIFRNHTVIECLLPEGAGSDLTVEVVVADQTGVAKGLFSYDPPVVTAISPSSSVIRRQSGGSVYYEGATAGGYTLSMVSSGYSAVRSLFVTIRPL